MAKYIQFCAVVLGVMCFAATDAYAAPPPEPEVPVRPPSVDILRRKLRRIVIPKIELEKATVYELVEFLRRRSRDLDPDGVGVNFILYTPSVSTTTAATLAADPFAVPKISASVENVTLDDALRLLASSSGLKYRLGPSAVIIADQSAPLDVMDIRVYTLHPNVLQRTGAKSARRFLENSGVEFLPGATVGYDRQSGKIVVKNTVENLDRVAVILKRISRAN